MARWKLCASTTFEIFPLSTRILCQQKSYISEGIQPILENFGFSSKMLMVCIWVGKYQVRSYFTFAMARWKLCPSTTFEILPLSTCTLWYARILYLQRYSTDFRNLCISSKMSRVGIRGEKFQLAQVFYFCNGKVKTFASKTFEILPLSTCTLCQQKSYIIQRYSTDFRKSSASARRCWGWPFEWKASGCAGVLLLQWQGENFALSSTFDIFPLLTCTRVPAKILNLQRYWIDFRKHWASARICWGWAFEWKVSGAQVFYFCNGKVKTCASRTFEILPPSTCTLCQQKSLYLQRCSTFFRNHSLSSKLDIEGVHLDGKLQMRRYFALQWQCENFAHRQHLVFCHFQHVHCARKNPISPSVFNRFSKSLLQLEDVEGRHLGGTFQVRRYFTFAMARWKLCASTTFDILTLSTCTVCQQKSCISKGIQPIYEIFASARKCWRWAFGEWAFGWKVCRCAGIFTFAMARWKLCASTTFEILPLSTCTLCQQKSYISKGIQPIFEIFASARRCRGWAFGWKVSSYTGILLLQWQGENFAHGQHLKFFHFQHCILCQQKSYISKGIQPILENFRLSSKMLMVCNWVG